MAFEAVLNQDLLLRPRKWKRITVSASLVLHAIALVVGVIYSFWHVDELPLPSVVVTLMSGAPPPPPPPPPPAGGTKKKTIKPKTKLEQPKTEMVQPKEQPKEVPPPEKEEEEEGEEGGVKGGEKGGVKGGVVGGVVGAPPPPPVKEQPKVLSMTIGHHQLAINPELEMYKVQVPPSLNRAGIQFSAIVTVSVSAQGQVVAVVVRKGADPAIDPQIPVVIRRWRYHPYLVDGRAVPFVYTFRYDVSAR